MYLLGTSTFMHRLPVYGKCIISNSMNRTKQCLDCCHKCIPSRIFPGKAIAIPHSSFTPARVFCTCRIFPRTIKQYYLSTLRPSRWSALVGTSRRTFHSSSVRRNGFRRADSTKNEPIPSLTVPKRSEIWRLLSLAEPEKYRLAVAIGLLLISSTVTIAVPFALGKVIDTIYNTSSEEGSRDDMMKRLTRLCTFLAGVFLVGAAANFGRVYLMQTSGQRIIKRLREMLFKSVVAQEIGFFDKTSTGELINRLSTDTSKIGQSLTSNISDGLRSTVQVIGGIGMMFYSSAQLATVVISIVPPFSVVAILYGRYVRSLSRKVQDSLATATQVAEERISSIRTVRAFSHEKREEAAYSDRVEGVFQLTKKEAFASGLFFGAMGLSGNLIIMTVLYNGGLMMTESQITVGDLSAFLLYAAYVGISIGGLSNFYAELMKGIGASTRLWELVDRKPSIPLSSGLKLDITQLKGAIDFNNLHFSYPMRRDMPIFTDLTLSVEAGSVMAVVGASGSGKSSLGALLLRYYDPIEGSITLDGKDTTILSPEWLRHQIGTVSQEPTLFSCSIRENISYGAVDPDDVSMEMIEEAAKTANAHNFIKSFPNQYETVVGERGLMLSGGQRQRIALARAVLKNPKILLLDEATSALDAESEYLVQEALERLMVGRTVITIAHRLSTIKNADMIAVLDSGRIAETGAYEELMRIPDGLFRKLVERQTVMN
ncbi:ATP-binding cassette sub-family B member 10, mitochondrial-like [Lytechinus pictus]|uniref:ATP-binding cassette sub-family B member 10, mitochondrial-like n=1 Tax=Lytechinus pictus TaxID=7653 RepID=UPI0030BA2366